MVKYVGIVNVTPDSFSDGGKYLAADAAVKRARELADAGASIIDIGAQSTRPRAEYLSADEEWQRLEPLLTQLADSPFEISIDTFHPEVIRRAMRLIPNLIINDVTTAHDPDMRQLIADSGLRVILSHLPYSVEGDIQAAHSLAEPTDDVRVVVRELRERQQQLIDMGAKHEQIILDPGIGFGKTMRLNNELVEFAQHIDDMPVLIGFSRKRFIKQYLGLDRYSIEVNRSLLERATGSGASYIRVHDTELTS